MRSEANCSKLQLTHHYPHWSSAQAKISCVSIHSNSSYHKKYYSFKYAMQLKHLISQYYTIDEEVSWYRQIEQVNVTFRARQ